MSNPLPHIIHDQTFWLSPERCLYWEEQRTLIVSDLHLGKSGHFRREGIAVPQSVYKADLQRLVAQLFAFKAEKLLIVGDMTHSKANKELDLFLKWRNDFPGLPFELVKGNHDILEDGWYRDAGITVHEHELKIGTFVFRHEKDPEQMQEPADDTLYTFSGHVHPGIRLKGAGKQALRFPCFYFGLHHAILPAFSRFTGTYLVVPQKGETVYALVEQELMKMGR